MKTRILVFVLTMSVAAFLEAAQVNIQYNYDSNGRLSAVNYGSKEISYTYDANGNLLNRSTAPSTAVVASLNHSKPAVVERVGGELNPLACKSVLVSSNLSLSVKTYLTLELPGRWKINLNQANS